jgi:hypothetical protein
LVQDKILRKFLVISLNITGISSAQKRNILLKFPAVKVSLYIILTKAAFWQKSRGTGYRDLPDPAK